MAQKKFWAAAGRIVLSGVLAFLILNAFCLLYYNVPVHADGANGATDHKWEANAFYSRGTEGFAWGKTNNDGYANLFDYRSGDRIDILIMGSSEMEAFAVAMEESTASRLNALLPDDTVYNIGVSAHNLLICADNLAAAIQTYQPRKYVVIETPYVSFSDKNLALAANGKTQHVAASTGGILAKLQKIPYLRLMYAQINHFMDAQGADNDLEDSGAKAAGSARDNAELVSALAARMGRTAREGGVQLIVLYHPGTVIEPDGTLTLKGDAAACAQFERLCAENGILFLDMSERFLAEYAKDYTVPCGFSNTSAGSGHLNRYGHAFVADELYRLIQGVE